MVQNMKVSGRMIKAMDKGFTPFPMDTNMKGNCEKWVQISFNKGGMKNEKGFHTYFYSFVGLFFTHKHFWKMYPR